MRAAIVLALVFAAAPARAVVPLCLETRAEPDEPGLRKLVTDELLHHPSHRLVESGCSSTLVVELFTVAGTRFLTVHVNRDVPVRFAVKNGHELEERLDEALRQTLRHDPVYLAEDLSRMNAVWRAGANVAKNGSNRYRLALVELVGATGRGAFFASGAAAEVARGIEHVDVYLRLAAAGAPGRSSGDATLRVLAGADIGCLWEASARANNTVYLGGGVGLHYVRFEGAPTQNTANTALFSVVARVGARFLRWYAADVDLFAEVHLPLYKTNDPDSPVIDAWTPYGAVGLAVGF